MAGRDRRRPGGTRGAGAARRHPARPAGRVRHRPRPVRPHPRRHPAGQPARGRRTGQRHRLRRLGLQLVPVRRGHLGELLRARAPRPRTDGRLADRLPPGDRPARGGRGRDLDVHPVPAPAAGRVDRLALGGGHRAGTGSRVHPGQLRPGREIPQPGRHALTAGPPTGRRQTEGKTGMFTSIAGRAVVVTGATRGIGKGIAGVFARSGARVLVTGRDEEAAKTTVAELGAGGAEVSYLLGDVSRREECERMAQAAGDRLGGIDVLCANAGIFPDARLADMTDADIDQVFGTNLKGCILSVQACLPALAASGRGRVILTSSITGPITGFPGWSHYGASKAGQLGFMRTAAIELAKYAITVNALLPGNVLTEGLVALGPDYERSMAASIPLKKLGTVED